MPVIRTSQVLVAALGLLVGCTGEIGGQGDESVETELSAIFNGSPVPAGVRPEVGTLTFPGPPFPFSCTATLLTQQYFLTASSCINFEGMRRGGTLSLENAPHLPIDRIFSLGNRLLGQHDLAVGRLVSPISTSIARGAVISNTFSNSNTTITQIGFGCTNFNGAGYGVKRYLTFTRATNEDVGCFKDFGGPSFFGTLNSGGQIALVYSHWWTNPIGGNNVDMHADPVLNRNNIYSIVDGLQNSDGICYRAHVSDIGWTPVVCDGALIDTQGLGRTVYAFQIWSNRPGVKVCYQAYLSNVGWQGGTNWVCNSDMAGTLGFADKGMQALRIRLDERPSGLPLSYQGRVGARGSLPTYTTNWVGDGVTIGEPGSGRRLEAFAVRFAPPQ
jgi:hypothetical protein